MTISLNELELQTTSPAHGLQVNVRYFTLPGETFAGLVRQVTLTNLGPEPLALELLDGLAVVIPYGVTNEAIKNTSRTIEAWMEVFNLAQGVPFYRLRASTLDSAEVTRIQAGHFYLAFTTANEQSRLLPAFVDPAVIFGANTALSAPDRFAHTSLADLQTRPQTPYGRLPCGFFGAEAQLEPSASLSVNAIIGHVSEIGRLQRQLERLTRPDYLPCKRVEARQLVESLTEVIAAQTGSPLFDAYTRQTFLDNILRGGWPLNLSRHVYHVYARKHGDLERDYNDFHLAAERYSQGNGNYRDVIQNRRSDVLFAPQVQDFNILAFLGLIQPDGYNPLLVNGSRFTLPPDRHAAILALVDRPDRLAPLLARPFTPGQLLQTVADQQLELAVPPPDFIAAALAHAGQHFEAAFGEGFWTDHWTYILDLIDTYLAVYPDKKAELLFEKPVVPWFDSPATVRPRAEKYLLIAAGQVRQYGAVDEDEEKAALIAARPDRPNLTRTAHGRGQIYRSTVFAKLVALAVIKFATLDPLGMGLEMEAGKPGWYDALNGLPGLFGSSLADAYELQRLFNFLLATMAERRTGTVDLPVEQADLLDEIAAALAGRRHSTAADRDFHYWDAAATARENYRRRTRLGFDGQTRTCTFDNLAPKLQSFSAHLQTGLDRAAGLNDGPPPTYLIFTAAAYEPLSDQPDAQGRRRVRVTRFEPVTLPLFLEGPVHALKLCRDAESARQLYRQVKQSELFDRKLKMYKVNAPLSSLSYEIGRARVFTPGWLENESIWLHMAYKYLLELLKAGLHAEFFAEFRQALVPFQDPAVYHRSPLENCSFIVSSAHPDASLHGAGFVARLTGATAEFLSIWLVMMAGSTPFFMHNGQLGLAFKPTLPGWLFDRAGRLTFTFLGQCAVTYHNPRRLDLFPHGGPPPIQITLQPVEGAPVQVAGGVILAPYAEMVRHGQIKAIHISFAEANDESSA